MAPRDRAAYGYARVRDAAFDAVRMLWRKRKAQGWTQSRLVNALDRDPGWVSRNLSGPGNWTLKTFGEMVEALDGEVEIVVRGLEEPDGNRTNYHAYDDFGGRTDMMANSGGRGSLNLPYPNSLAGTNSITIPAARVMVQG